MDELTLFTFALKIWCTFNVLSAHHAKDQNISKCSCWLACVLGLIRDLVHRNFKNLEFSNINLIIKRSLFQMFTKGGADPIQCMKIGSLKFNFGTN